MSVMWSTWRGVTETPEAGSSCWQELKQREESGAGRGQSRSWGTRGQRSCGEGGDQARPHMMVALSSSISSRSRRASSCIWLRSCCSLVMYSTVFCSVMAWLLCRDRQLSGDLGSASCTLLCRAWATHRLGVVGDQAVEGVEAHLDVEASLLFG